MPITIPTPKFEIGQKVYNIARADVERRTCEACKGLGWIRLKTKRRMRCGDCYGECEVNHFGDVRFVPEEVTVSKIEIQLVEDGASILYTVTNPHYTYETSDEPLIENITEALRVAAIKTQRLREDTAQERDDALAREQEGNAPVEPDEDFNRPDVTQVTLNVWLWQKVRLNEISSATANALRNLHSVGRCRDCVGF
jgi:ferredoxin